MFPHHGEGEPSPLMKQLFDEQQKEAAKRLQDQLDGRAKRHYSNGRKMAEDEGDVAFAISALPEKGIVTLDFGKELSWVGMTPQQAVELAQALIRQARTISTEPLKIVLY